MINIIIEEVNKNYQELSIVNDLKVVADNANISIDEYLKNINHISPTQDAILYMSKHTPDLVDEYLRLTQL